MTKRRMRALLFSLVMIAVLLLAACAPESDQAAEPAADSTEDEEKIFEAVAETLPISQPDEAYALLRQETDEADWGNYADATAQVDTQNTARAAFSIGVRGTNAILLTALGRPDEAQTVADAIVRGAESLSIETDEIVSLVGRLQTALESDSAGANREARVILSSIQAELVRALQDLDDDTAAHNLQLGAWLESLYQGSGIVRDDYSERASSLFRRQSEVATFVQVYAPLAVEDETYQPVVDSLLAIGEAMTSSTDRVIPRDQIETIHSIAGDLRNEWL